MAIPRKRWTRKANMGQGLVGSYAARLVPPSGRLQAVLDGQRPVPGNMGFVFINPVTQAPYSMSSLR